MFSNGSGSKEWSGALGVTVQKLPDRLSLVLDTVRATMLRDAHTRRKSAVTRDE